MRGLEPGIQGQVFQGTAVRGSLLPASFVVLFVAVSVHKLEGLGFWGLSKASGLESAHKLPKSLKHNPPITCNPSLPEKLNRPRTSIEDPYKIL